MIPKLIRGASFKGAAAYLLHDKGAATAERVDWTHTRNLASPDPDTAWRVMAATALDAGRLKALAGVKNTGRKSDKAVLHLVLSWHPDEAQGLDPAQMLAAAESALAALGAEDRQALIIAHNDNSHPHLHILCNRVSPEDGRMLPSSKEKLKLSRWAEAYEKARGRIFCEERVLNNEARSRGDYARAEKPVPWPILEAEQVLRGAANDNRSRLERLRAEQREAIRKLGGQTRATLRRHQAAWRGLESDHQTGLAAIAAETGRRRAKARNQILAEFRPLWRALRAEEKARLEAFKARETSILGRLRNSVSTIEIGRSAIDGEPLRVMTQSFAAIFSRERRRGALEKRFEQDRAALLRRQRAAVRRAATQILRERGFAQSAAREAFRTDRSALIDAHRAEEAALRASWRALAERRREAYAKLDHVLDRRTLFRQAATAESLYERIKRQALARGFGEATHEQDNERER